MNTADKDALMREYQEVIDAHSEWLTTDVVGERFIRLHRAFKAKLAAAADLVAVHPAEMAPVGSDPQTALSKSWPIVFAISRIALYGRNAAGLHHVGRLAEALDGTQQGRQLRWMIETRPDENDPPPARVIHGSGALPALVEPVEGSHLTARSDEGSPAVGVGSPVSAAMEVLTELVACKDIQTQAEALEFAGPSSSFGERWRGEHDRLRKDYIRRKAGLWDRAKALVSAQGATR